MTFPVCFHRKNIAENGHSFSVLRLFRSSVRCASSDEVRISVRSQPFGAGQMTLPRSSRPLSLAHGIDMEHKTRDFLPVGSLAVCVEQPKVRDKVLLVVPGQNYCIRCAFGDWRIK